MEGIAQDRERFALALPGERHALFLAVLASDLAAYGVAELYSRARAAASRARAEDDG